MVLQVSQLHKEHHCVDIFLVVGKESITFEP